MTTRWPLFNTLLISFVAACGSAERPAGGNGLSPKPPTETPRIVATTNASAAVASVQPTPPAVPEIMVDWLPFAISRLPALLYRVEHTKAYRAEIVDDACGGIDVEKRLTNLAPDLQVREVAPALRHAEQSRPMLFCRRELKAKIREDARAWYVNFAVSESRNMSITESVRVFALDMTPDKFPPPSEYNRDATAVTGLPWARCDVGYRRPQEQGCEDESPAIGKWPEGNLWLTGRIVGIRLFLEAYRRNTPNHELSAALRSVIEATKDLQVGEIELPSVKREKNGRVVGIRSDGKEVTRFLAPDPEVAKRILSELENDQQSSLTIPLKLTTSCPRCPPGLAKVTIEHSNASKKRTKEILRNKRFRIVDGMVEAWELDTPETPEYTKAKANFDAAQAKRKEKVQKLLDDWIAGSPPKPEAFRETQGDAFVRELQKLLR